MVVLSKQGKNTVAVLEFFDQPKKVKLPARRITEQPVLLTKSKISLP